MAIETRPRKAPGLPSIGLTVLAGLAAAGLVGMRHWPPPARADVEPNGWPLCVTPSGHPVPGHHDGPTVILRRN